MDLLKKTRIVTVKYLNPEETYEIKTMKEM